jgi:hypothetical protein
MPPGIGYSFQPGVDTVSMGGGGASAPNISPQQAVKILSFRVPKAPLGGNTLAPRELLQSAGAAGMPGGSLNALLSALAQLMQQQPQDQQTELANYDPSQQQRNGILFPAPKYDPYVAPTPIKTTAPPRVTPALDPVPVDARPLMPLGTPQSAAPVYESMPTQFDMQSIEPLPF